MNIGDEIILRGKILDFDGNPHGPAIKVEVKGFLSERDYPALGATFYEERVTKFWIQRIEQLEVIMRNPYLPENEVDKKEKNCAVTLVVDYRTFENREHVKGRETLVYPTVRALNEEKAVEKAILEVKEVNKELLAQVPHAKIYPRSIKLLS